MVYPGDTALLSDAVTACVTLLLFVTTQYLRHLSELKETRIKYLEEQLSKFYGPLLCILECQHRSLVKIRHKHGLCAVEEGSNQWRGFNVTELSEDFQQYFESVYYPLSEQAFDIIRANLHLISPVKISCSGDDSAVQLQMCLQYCEHITSCKRHLKKFRQENQGHPCGWESVQHQEEDFSTDKFRSRVNIIFTLLMLDLVELKTQKKHLVRYLTARAGSMLGRDHASANSKTNTYHV